MWFREKEVKRRTERNYYSHKLACFSCCFFVIAIVSRSYRCVGAMHELSTFPCSYALAPACILLRSSVFVRSVSSHPVLYLDLLSAARTKATASSLDLLLVHVCQRFPSTLPTLQSLSHCSLLLPGHLLY